MAPAPGFLGDFSDDDIDWLSKHGVQQHYAAKRVLVEEGEQPGALYVVLEGAFVVYSEVLGITFASLGPGELIGEMSYVSDGPALATVRAEEDSIVLEIPHGRLRAHIAKDQGFSGRFHRVISEFTVERLKAFKEQHLARQAAYKAREEESRDLSNKRVYELIERMLRGDFS